MRTKIPYGTDYWSLSLDYIKTQHVVAYRELYYETGDNLWKFLWEFSETGNFAPGMRF